jgi:hypothetical protein
METSCDEEAIAHAGLQSERERARERERERKQVLRNSANFFQNLSFADTKRTVDIIGLIYFSK